MNGELWEYLRECDQEEVREAINYLEELSREARSFLQEDPGEAPASASRPPARSRGGSADPREEPEYFSDNVSGNHWMRIGVPRDLVKRLSKLGRRIGVKKGPCSGAVWALVMLGLRDQARTEAELAAYALGREWINGVFDSDALSNDVRLGRSDKVQLS